MMRAISFTLAVLLFLFGGTTGLGTLAGASSNKVTESSPESAETVEASPETSLSPGEIEDWALGCSAILATRNGMDPYQFGMFSKSEWNVLSASTMLSRDWGVEDRADLRATIERMTDGGHNEDFAEAYEMISALSEKEYQALLAASQGMDGYMWPLTKALGDKWGDKQIKAWDWFRMIHLAGWGYIAGYVEIEEAYELMTPVIERLRDTFSSWEEATENYMDGYAWWSRTDISKDGSEYTRRLEIYEDIKTDKVLYNPELWQPGGVAVKKTRHSTEAFSYEDNGDGTCTILKGLGTLSGELSIPDVIDGLTVTAIGDNAFTDATGLTGTLRLPDGLLSIGAYAFSSCSGLTGTLRLPEGLTSIGHAAFYYCYGFTGELNLPAGLESIGSGAFAYCDGFTGRLTIPDGITVLESDTFSNCIGISRVVIPQSVTAMEADAFTGCWGLQAFEVSEENGAYASADGILLNKAGTEILLAPQQLQIDNYAIPSGVTAIADWAFFGCIGLTGTLTLPDSVTSIGNWAFSDCMSLTGLVLPKGIETIGRMAFSGCMDLTGTLTIPDGVRVIESNAFLDCVGLSEVILPEGLTTIEEYAFSGCEGLSGIALPASLSTLGLSAFQRCGNLEQAVFSGDAPESVEADVFTGCAEGFEIRYHPDAEGWSTPDWNGYPAYPKAD